MPGRRTVLGAGLSATATGVLLTLTGCRLRIGSPSHRSPSSVEPVPDSTDHVALNHAAAQSEQLSALYAQAVLVRPDIATSLQPLAADHAAHLRALQALGAHGDAVGDLPSPSIGATAPPTPTTTTTTTTTTTSSTSSTSPSTAATAPATTGTPSTTGTPTEAQLTAAAAVSVLGQAERTAVGAAFADLASTGGQVARLLASIAACSSTHLTLLARLPGTPATAGAAPSPTTTPPGPAR